MDPVTERFDCTTEPARSEGIAAAQTAIAAKQCIVMPTDTVYGIAADAFSAQAVATLLAAKGRGRNMPPPVLIARVGTMDGLAAEVPEDARLLANFFWPGALTLILRSQPSLSWDLGDTRGTVALRIPDDSVARDLLKETGPLAVSSANRSGQPAATTAAEAEEMLGESVSVYLDDGPRPPEQEGLETSSLPSTIVDCTRDVLRVVRQGALSLAELRERVPSLLGIDESGPDAANVQAEPEGSGVELKEHDDAGEPGTPPATA
ncbi:L-threonylcarbamoyladenylate synthase [Arthrobacter rhombi]|uniref:L-threonylcarbamoyladenylate synthase n=1 Tax=Arthrobacter rhombi TaxID=71253 RepID=UPI003FCFB45C